MATQVEALLPGAPLLPAEERALVLKPPQDGGREKGEQQQQQQQPQQQQPMGPDGGPAAPRPPSAKQQKEESNNQEKESLLRGAEPEEGGEAGGGGGAGGRREFIEAPPPKVNPWTKNAAALAVNGQSPPDIFPADGQSGHELSAGLSAALEESLTLGLLHGLAPLPALILPGLLQPRLGAERAPPSSPPRCPCCASAPRAAAEPTRLFSQGLQPQPAPDGRPQVAGPTWRLLLREPRALPAFPALSINRLIRRGAFADVLGGIGAAGVALLRDDRGIAGSVLGRPGTCLCQGSRVRRRGWSCTAPWALLRSPGDSEVAPYCALLVAPGSWASLAASLLHFGNPGHVPAAVWEPLALPAKTVGEASFPQKTGEFLVVSSCATQGSVQGVRVCLW